MDTNSGNHSMISLFVFVWKKETAEKSTANLAYHDMVHFKLKQKQMYEKLKLKIELLIFHSVRAK